MGGDLVTGEAVVLELRLAKLPSRIVAESLDLLAQFGAIWVLGFAIFPAMGAGLDTDTVVALLLLAYVAVIVGYPVVFETFSRGRSLGKLAMGLRVVRDDGGPIRFRHALVRGLVGVLEIYISAGSIAIITCLVSVRGKRVGDFLAGTVVVRERVPTIAAPMVLMPPQLAGWATALELSRLPDELALSARQFMARAPGLEPGVRHAMGGQLAHEVSRYVAPPPPPGCPPEPYLAAVLAERRQRDSLRYGGPQPVAPYPYPQYPQYPQQYPQYPQQAPQVQAPPPVPNGGAAEGGFVLPS